MIHARPDYQNIQAPDGKIPADEPVFLLRAQDQTAAEVVRYWAKLNQHGDVNAVAMALRHADLMDGWPIKKEADVPLAARSTKITTSGGMMVERFMSAALLKQAEDLTSTARELDGLLESSALLKAAKENSKEDK